MEQTGIFHGVSARKYIKEFSGEMAEKYGLDPKFVEKDIIKAKKYNHISFGEYEWTGFYRLSEAQKRTVSTLWTRAEFRKTFTDRRYICILMNKFIFSKVFDEFYRRKCFMAAEMNAELVKRLAGDCGKIVYKPNCKGQGQGVRVLNVETDEQLAAALELFKSEDNAIVEEFIRQHEVMASFNPNAVNIVRFYSVASHAGMYIFAPVLTTAVNMDISNGSQDALTAVVDIRTGRVLTDAVDQNNIVDYSAHPLTGTAFRGAELPYWQECVELLRRAVPLAGKISNIGWDVAITENGPLIIEANTIPGFNSAQYRGFGWVTEGCGYQPLFDEGLKGIAFRDDGRYEKTVLKIR